MINYDDVTKENINNHNLNWLQIPDYPYIILIIGGSGSGKTNASLKLIKKQVDDYSFIDKMYLYVKDSNEAKYQYLKNKWENPGLKCFHDSKAFNDYSTDMDNIYQKILKSTIQIKAIKYWLFLIWLLVCYA